MSKLLTGILGAAAGGAAGYGLGKHVQRKKSHQQVTQATQSSELATKLRERSESENRRLQLENYYVRKALNELAKRMRSQ